MKRVTSLVLIPLRWSAIWSATFTLAAGVETDRSSARAGGASFPTSSPEAAAKPLVRREAHRARDTVSIAQQPQQLFLLGRAASSGQEAAAAQTQAAEAAAPAAADVQTSADLEKAALEMRKEERRKAWQALETQILSVFDHSKDARATGGGGRASAGRGDAARQLGAPRPEGKSTASKQLKGPKKRGSGSSTKTGTVAAKAKLAGKLLKTTKNITRSPPQPRSATDAEPRKRTASSANGTSDVEEPAVEEDVKADPDWLPVVAEMDDNRSSLAPLQLLPNKEDLEAARKLPDPFQAATQQQPLDDDWDGDRSGSGSSTDDIVKQAAEAAAAEGGMQPGSELPSAGPAVPGRVKGIGDPYQRADTRVSCGGHSASECEACPQGHGKDWCNGHCEWKGEVDDVDDMYCKFKRSLVWCGARAARHCGLCLESLTLTNESGEQYCRGECHWQDGKCFQKKGRDGSGLQWWSAQAMPRAPSREVEERDPHWAPGPGPVFAPPAEFVPADELPPRPKTDGHWMWVTPKPTPAPPPPAPVFAAPAANFSASNLTLRSGSAGGASGTTIQGIPPPQGGLAPLVAGTLPAFQVGGILGSGSDVPPALQLAMQIANQERQKAREGLWSAKDSAAVEASVDGPDRHSRAMIGASPDTWVPISAGGHVLVPPGQPQRSALAAASEAPPPTAPEAPTMPAVSAAAAAAAADADRARQLFESGRAGSVGASANATVGGGAAVVDDQPANAEEALAGNRTVDLRRLALLRAAVENLTTSEAFQEVHRAPAAKKTPFFAEFSSSNQSVIGRLQSELDTLKQELALQSLELQLQRKQLLARKEEEVQVSPSSRRDLTPAGLQPNGLHVPATHLLPHMQEQAEQKKETAQQDRQEQIGQPERNVELAAQNQQLPQQKLQTELMQHVHVGDDAHTEVAQGDVDGGEVGQGFSALGHSTRRRLMEVSTKPKKQADGRVTSHEVSASRQQGVVVPNHSAAPQWPLMRLFQAAQSHDEGEPMPHEAQEQMQSSAQMRMFERREGQWWQASKTAQQPARMPRRLDEQWSHGVQDAQAAQQPRAFRQQFEGQQPAAQQPQPLDFQRTQPQSGADMERWQPTAEDSARQQGISPGSYVPSSTQQGLEAIGSRPLPEEAAYPAPSPTVADPQQAYWRHPAAQPYPPRQQTFTVQDQWGQLEAAPDGTRPERAWQRDYAWRPSEARQPEQWKQWTPEARVQRSQSNFAAEYPAATTLSGRDSVNSFGSGWQSQATVADPQWPERRAGQGPYLSDVAGQPTEDPTIAQQPLAYREEKSAARRPLAASMLDQQASHVQAALPQYTQSMAEIAEAAAARSPALAPPTMRTFASSASGRGLGMPQVVGMDELPPQGGHSARRREWRRLRDAALVPDVRAASADSAEAPASGARSLPAELGAAQQQQRSDLRSSRRRVWLPAAGREAKGAEPMHGAAAVPAAAADVPAQAAHPSAAAQEQRAGAPPGATAAAAADRGVRSHWQNAWVYDSAGLAAVRGHLATALVGQPGDMLSAANLPIYALSLPVAPIFVALFLLVCIAIITTIAAWRVHVVASQLPQGKGGASPEVVSAKPAAAAHVAEVAGQQPSQPSTARGSARADCRADAAAPRFVPGTSAEEARRSSRRATAAVVSSHSAGGLPGAAPPSSRCLVVEAEPLEASAALAAWTCNSRLQTGNSPAPRSTRPSEVREQQQHPGGRRAPAEGVPARGPGAIRRPTPAMAKVAGGAPQPTPQVPSQATAATRTEPMAQARPSETEQHSRKPEDEDDLDWGDTGGCA
eukprot:TRINITY_DN27046_c0_g2_i1.p1 TRINITY_DN27046_c0_g2~~TRINITY_DN27046_c0_g2_i1.p1  ORF type:complete len:1826 (-),score=454.48 TRINITY_DN27046_c0_g2_i1:2-5359(-)